MLLFDLTGQPIAPGRARLSQHWNALEPVPAWLTRRTSDTDAASTPGTILNAANCGPEQYPGWGISTGAPVGSTSTWVAPQVDVTHPALFALRMRAIFNGGAAGNRKFELGWRNNLDGTVPTAGYDAVCDAADSEGYYFARQRGWTADGETTTTTRHTLAWSTPTTMHDVTLWWTPKDGYTYLGPGVAIDAMWPSTAAQGLVTPYIRTTATQAGAKGTYLIRLELDYWYL